jgi:hypothetical protein
MGYAMCFAPCFACKKTFGFNPNRVPNIRVDGVKEPICRDCIYVANIQRIEKGLEPFTIHPEAYKPCDEMELP